MPIESAFHTEWLPGGPRRLDRPTLVLLSTEFHSSLDYPGHFQEIASDIDALCLDIASCGKAACPGRPLTVEEQVRQVAAALEAEGVVHPLFVSWCSNSEFALLLQRRLGGPGSVLLSPLLRFGMELWVDYFYGMIMKAVDAMDDLRYNDMFNILLVGSEYFESNKMLPMTNRIELRALMNTPGFRDATAQGRPRGAWDWAEVGRLPGRVLVVRGERDPLFPRALYRDAFAGCDMRLVELAAGHRVMLERKADAHREILAFARLCAAEAGVPA